MGILGLTLKYGKIGKIILEVYKRNPETLRYAFGRNTVFLIDILKVPLEVQLSWADSVSAGRNKLRLSKPWHSAFERFGELEEIQIRLLALFKSFALVVSVNLCIIFFLMDGA